MADEPFEKHIERIECYSVCNFEPPERGSASKIDPLPSGLMRCSLDSKRAVGEC